MISSSAPVSRHTYARVLPVLLCWQTVLTDSQKKRMGAMYMYSFVAVVDNNNTC